MSYRIRPYQSEWDKSHFNSASEALNQYLKTQVSQDIKRRIASCYVALDDNNQISGYYTLAASSIVLDSLPEALRKKLPRYPSVPAVLMGRLAVDSRHCGNGLDKALLMDAILRAANAEIAAYALMVDAKDQQAAAFYLKLGFTAFTEAPLKYFYPLANLKTLK